MGTTEDFGTEECALLVVADSQLKRKLTAPDQPSGACSSAGASCTELTWRPVVQHDLTSSPYVHVSAYLVLSLIPSSDRCCTSALQDSAFSSAQLKQNEVVHAIHHISELIAFGGLEPCRLPSNDVGPFGSL